MRRHLAAEQRRIAVGGNYVCEGRDQGTFVFQDAACKFFLTAEPRARAERRHRELLAKGESVTLEEILKSQAERDARDAARDLAPMDVNRGVVIKEFDAQPRTRMWKPIAVPE